MNIALSDNILSVDGLVDLNGANSEVFRQELRAAWPAGSLKAIEVDLSQTKSVDSCGLAALIAVHKWALEHNNNNGAIPVRLLNPPPPVQQILELTRLHRTFEIVKRS